MLNRLRRGDDKDMPTNLHTNKKPTLQRTDSDERRFATANASGFRQYGSDSQPICIDDDAQQTIVEPSKNQQTIVEPETCNFEQFINRYGGGYKDFDELYSIYLSKWHPERLTTRTEPKSEEEKKDEECLQRKKDFAKKVNNALQEDTQKADFDQHLYDEYEACMGQPMKPIDWDTFVKERDKELREEDDEEMVHSSAPVADTTESELPKGVVTPVSTHGSKGKFQLRNKMIALTYPQCDMDKQKAKTILEGICSKWGPNVIVAQERHTATEGLHLHAFVKCDQSITVRDTHFFDLIDNGKTFTAHIEVVKCSPAYIKYITKSDKDPARTLGFQIDKYLEAKENKKVSVSSKIVEAVRNGATLRDVRNNFGSFMLLHQKQVAEFITKTRDDVRLHEATLKWKKVLRFDGVMNHSFTNAQIAGWLNDHLLQQHKFRGMNLWVKGPTKCGKTSLVQRLIELGCQVFTVNNETEFFDGINDDTQLIVFDEFKAQKKITTMNGLCDGHNCRLNIKGGTYEITRPIPVLILSNFTCQEAYHKSDQEHLKTLLGRFIHLVINENEHIAITTTTK